MLENDGTILNTITPSEVSQDRSEVKDGWIPKDQRKKILLLSDDL